MANVKISALPQYTAGTNLDLYFVNNNSGETETTKIQLNEFNGFTNNNDSNAIQSASWLVGLGTTATTESAIAIGNGAEATSPYSIAIGYDALNSNRDGSRDNYICIGRSTRAVQESFALGTNAKALGQSTCSIGDEAETYGNGALAIGKNSLSQSTNGTAVGKDAEDFSNNNGLALGYNAKVRQDSGITIGNVDNNVEFGVLIGGSNQVFSGGSKNSSINSHDGDVNSTGSYNGQLNAYDSVISGSTSGATMIGTQSRVADDDDTTYVENLRTFGQYYSNGSLNTGSTITIDFNTGNIHFIEVSGNLSLTLDNVKNGGRYCIITTTTGNYTITSKTASGFTFKTDSGFDTLGNSKTHKLTLDVIGNVIYGTHTADLT